MEDLLTVRDVAHKMCMTTQTIYRYIMKKEIPFHKVNRAVRFIPSELDTWIKNRETAQATARTEQAGELFAGPAEGGEDAGAQA